MASATRALSEMGSYVEELEAERDQLNKDMDRLLVCIRACRDLCAVAKELEAGREEKNPEGRRGRSSR